MGGYTVCDGPELFARAARMRPRRLVLCILSGLLLLARCCAVAGQHAGGRRRLTSQGASSLTLHMFDAYPAYASYPDAVCNDGTPGARTPRSVCVGKGAL